MIGPENFTEFLYWVKETTEKNWENVFETYGEDIHFGWLNGAKWIGMSDAEIDKVEKSLNIEFTTEHREFLRILHTVDKKEPLEGYEDGEIVEVSYFYNWLHDKEEIQKSFEWPYETILQDIEEENSVWLRSWGNRPKDKGEREAIFANWYRNAPSLIPVLGSRYVVSNKDLPDNPVISLRGSDIIVYGWDFKHYLIKELDTYLNLYEWVFDKEDQTWYPEQKEEYVEYGKTKYTESQSKDIPFWREMILFWSSGWRSFGMEYPRFKGQSIRPIVKTYNIEEE